MTGSVTLTSPAYIVQQAVPASSSVLCNKAYVDGKLANTGGTVTGNITMNSTSEVIQPKAPSTANSLCNKTYLDSKLPLGGGTVTEDLYVSATGANERICGCSDIPNVAFDGPNNSYCFLQLGNRQNGITSSCASDAGIGISSVGSVAIGTVNPSTNVLTTLATFGTNGTH